MGKYLNERKYQKVVKTLIMCAVLVLIIGLSIGGHKIYSGIVGKKAIELRKENKEKDKENYKKTLKAEQEKNIVEKEKKITELKTQLENKRKELENKGIEYDYFAKYTDGEKYDLKVITDVLDPSMSYYESGECKNHPITKEYCLLMCELNTIKNETDESFDSKFESDYEKKYGNEFRNEMDAESLISFGGFICFMTFLLAGSIYAEARKRNIIAFKAQQAMPVYKETIDEMGPSVGNVIGKIAKSFRRGSNEADRDNR